MSSIKEKATKTDKIIIPLIIIATIYVDTANVVVRLLSKF